MSTKIKLVGKEKISSKAITPSEIETANLDDKDVAETFSSKLGKLCSTDNMVFLRGQSLVPRYSQHIFV